MSIGVRNLVKRYGDRAAINDISFDVKTGEILGFLGPNGAGKTTTMKIITCYMPPTSGTVDVDGMDVREHSLEVRKKIGYLPEMNPLYFDMNALDSLELAAELHGLRGNAMQQRVKEMVDVCGLEAVRHKDIGEMSKGYRQRVGLAQAMIPDPDVLSPPAASTRIRSWRSVRSSRNSAGPRPSFFPRTFFPKFKRRATGC